MSRTYSILAVLAALVAYALWTLKPFLDDGGVFAGPVEKLGVEGCARIPGPRASEKIVIHHRSGTAFMVSFNLLSHLQWFPPGNHWNETVQEADEFYKYDIKMGVMTKLKIRNFPAHNDLVLHGFDIWDPLYAVRGVSSEGVDADVLNVLAINHKHNGSSIEIFEHKLGSDELTHVETVEDPELRVPNDVLAIGPRKFYVTNANYHKEGLLKKFEEITVPPWGNVVVRHDSSLPLKVVAEGIKYANGISANWDRSLIYVASTFERGVHVYQRSETDGWSLSQVDFIYTGLLVDNLSVDEVTGEIYAIGPPRILPILKIMMTDPAFTSSTKAPTRVIKISNNTGPDRFYGIKHVIEDILVDDGTLVSFGTMAAVDGGRGVLLLGGLMCENVICRRAPSVAGVAGRGDESNDDD